ncbi:Ger(x)C family spore germination protein [Ammoniphilus sp. YIM 78166]|uniref:Ger(x)C family spore germination protein n=1 Tax=Ammoniphilus sp. YIM 78166 TaxID=1644106 RepID=UPI00107063FF|nr:Ger(x)C family spore germination protein [Ammoniphilus sp. YIM 78166]
MKQVYALCFILLSCLLVSGCWDRTEVNDLALATGLGLDMKDDDTIEITIEMHIPKLMGAESGGGGDAPVTMVRSGDGRTIAEAIARLNERIPRRVFWGHLKAIIFGEQFAKTGIRETVDFLVRHPQPRLRAKVFVAKGTAKEILELQPPLERSQTEVLRELANSEVLLNITLKELLQMLSGDAQTAALPMITKLPVEKGLKPLQTIGYVNQTAIFKKDKMVATIGEKLTRGVLWFRNEIQVSTVTVQPKEAQGYISLLLIDADSQLIPRIENGKWKMTIKAVLEDDAVLNGTTFSLMDPTFVKSLEETVEEELQKRLKQTLDKVQKDFKTDILGFAEAFHRKYPKEWQKVRKNWEDTFASVEVDFDIKAYVRRPGLASTPQGIPKDEVKTP